VEPPRKETPLRRVAAARRLELSGLGAYFRLRDATRFGLSADGLGRLVGRGLVERVARGLYRRLDVEPDENETLAMVGAKSPGGIFCLLTALRFHDLGTRRPPEAWLGLSRRHRVPTDLPVRLRVVRFEGAALTYGVEQHEVLGVPVKVTSPARTIVDCFRFERLVGREAAVEALQAGLDEGRVTVAELERVLDVLPSRTLRTLLAARAA